MIIQIQKDINNIEEKLEERLEEKLDEKLKEKEKWKWKDKSESYQLEYVKYIKDTIHLPIPVTRLALSIIDTPEFKRLTRLRQLGMVYYIYPTANHTRAEHCLGVYKLTRDYLDHICKYVDDVKCKFILTPRMKELICIAGLIHDLNHCVGNHLFDHHFAKKYNLPFHEMRSQTLFRSMVSRYSLAFSDDEVNFICSVISGVCLPGYPKWVYQIVSNSYFELDTDKLDYLLRDAFYTGIPSALQIDRIFTNCRLSPDGDIIFHKKIFLEIHDVFMARYRLHKNVYQHHTAVGIEFMFKDYLENFLKIPEIEQMLIQGDWFFFSDDIIMMADSLLSLHYVRIPTPSPSIFNSEWVDKNLSILQKCSEIKRKLDSRKFSKKFIHQSFDNPDARKKTTNDVGNDDEDDKIEVKVSLGMCSKNTNPISQILFYEEKENEQVNLCKIIDNINIRHYPFEEISQLISIKDHENVIFTFKNNTSPKR